MNRIKIFFEYIVQIIFGLLLNFRLIGLITLTFIAISVIFKWKGAELNTNNLILCGIIFLISVFDDIQKWDIWGFRGEKKDLSSVPQGNSVAQDAERPSQEDIKKEENKPLQLMPNEEGNFLKLAFEIERLLRVMARVAELKDIQSNVNLRQIIKKLNEKGIITDQGKAQIEAVMWLRNLLVHGRANEINQNTFREGTDLAFNLYNEIYGWLNPSDNSDANKTE